MLLLLHLPWRLWLRLQLLPLLLGGVLRWQLVLPMFLLALALLLPVS
jgi:hypothetical protein